MSTIGDKIKELRKAKKISQEDLSFELGVSRQTIHKWEKDAMQPGTDNLKLLCDFFKVTPNYFFDNNSGANSELAVAETNLKRKSKYKLLIFIIISVVIFLAFVISIIFTIGSGLIAFTRNSGHETVASLIVDSSTFYIFLVLSLILLAIEILMIFHIKNR